MSNLTDIQRKEKEMAFWINNQGVNIYDRQSGNTIGYVTKLLWVTELFSKGLYECLLTFFHQLQNVESKFLIVVCNSDTGHYRICDSDFICNDVSVDNDNCLVDVYRHSVSYDGQYIVVEYRNKGEYKKKTYNSNGELCETENVSTKKMAINTIGENGEAVQVFIDV